MDKTWMPGRPQTLVGVLERWAEERPDRVALTMQGQHVTYSRLLARSNAHAHGLLALGVRPGDVVAILSENDLAQVFLEFATARICAIEVMLNTALKGTFLSHQLRDSTAKILVVQPHLLGAVLDVLDDVPALATIVLTEPTPDLGRTPSRPVRFTTLAELADGAEHDPGGIERPGAATTCAIVYTSGTTGLSKGVQLSHNYLCLFAELESGIWYRDPADTYLSVGPLFHLGAKGMGVLGAISRGVRCVQEERFSVSAFWRRVREENATATTMLGSIPMLLWGLQPSADEGIRTVIGIPIPAELHGPMQERWRCTFESAYGLSECAPVVHTGPDAPMRPGSAGKIETAYYDVRVFDENDEELPPGQMGEVVVRPRRPHSMFDGYWNNPEGTLRVMRNQWFHTGDMGRFDEDGYFYFMDRSKDCLRRRGENISSYEVECAVIKHPAVQEAAVVAAPSEIGEDEVKAIVTLREGASATYEDIAAFCIRTMPYFTVPRFLKIVDTFPYTPSGKIMKTSLRDIPNAECWDREIDGGIVLSGKRSLQATARPDDPAAASAP